VTLVLKGAPTVVATSDGQVYLNSTGNPGMATAGAGDVLSGIIAGFVAQGSPPVHAACSGVYLHGLAGDHAKQNVGEYGLIATDLIRSFAQVLKDVTPPASRRHF
jgi:NAD(P)H-hydrate repair Nnr-like enzyme with NAD(P)H-hydrate dehydratase domain